MTSSGIASVVLAGNVTRDPELNESGRVLNIGLAVNRRVKDKDGEYEDAVSFFDIKVLGNRAEGLSKILAKGERITVAGELVQERWEKDGEKRSAVRVLAREVVLGGSGERSEPASRADETGGW